MKLGHSIKSRWRNSAMGRCLGLSLKMFAREQPTGIKWLERKRQADHAPQLVAGVRR